MSETNERSVASAGSVAMLRSFVEEREHKTVGISLPDGRMTCGVMVPVVLLEDAIAEITRLRLTDSEKKAVKSALGWCDDRDTETIATLCGLLERLGAANSGDNRRSVGGE